MNRTLIHLFFIITLVGCDARNNTNVEFDMSKLTQNQRDALSNANRDPLFNGTDIGLWIRGGRIVDIINSINTIPEEQRSVTIQVTKENANLVDEADYYLNLDDLPNNKAKGSISNIEAEWMSDGALIFGTELKINGTTKIHAHYKPVINAGVHVGLNLNASAGLKGRLNFIKSQDPKKLFEANFELLPSIFSSEISTSIRDQKDFCWRVEYPCAGTWSDPIRKCEAMDCKRLWEYDIPIGYKIRETIKTDRAMSLPIEVNLPNSLRLQKDVNGVSFDKTIKLAIRPQDFRADSQGLALRVGIDVTELSSGATNLQ